MRISDWSSDVCSSDLGRQWLLHSDASYHSNPLLALTGDGAIRGAGLELRLYGVDPDTAAARAEALGFTVLQAPADKPPGLREAYIVGPDGYVWVPSVHSKVVRDRKSVV